MLEKVQYILPGTHTASRAGPIWENINHLRENYWRVEYLTDPL